MVVVGADPQEVAAGGRVVDAKAGPARGAVCVRVGAKALDGVSGRGLVCVQTKVRGLRWRFAPTTTTTTTTSVAPSTTVAVVPTVSLAATFIDSGKFPKAAVVTANVAGTVYLIEGASPVSTVSDITSARYYRWTSGVVTANTPTSIALDVDVLTNGYYRVFVANSQGVLSAPAFNKVTISISRVSDVAALSCAAGGVCVVGDIGPGGGKVFYVHASGTFACGATLASTCKYLEAAPSDHSSTAKWCSDNSSYLRVTATGIGSGMSNTATADSTCTSGAIQVAADYTNNGKTDWHLPSKDELNQMYVNKVAIGDFAIAIYWSSSEKDAATAWYQGFGGGYQDADNKEFSDRVRPVRAFGGTVACADGGACAVGDIGPGGGVVFYVQASGGTFACGPTLASTCRYLEAAPTTGTNSWTDARYRWSGNEVDFIGSTAQGVAVGTGYKNTEAIVTQSSTANRAGTIARAYRGPNNLSDWYLPSKDELNELYLERVRVGGLSGSRYWSSSENENLGNQAWFQLFSTGLQGNNSYKNTDSYVRPVRAFG
jgi:hypothetical protein